MDRVTSFICRMSRLASAGVATVGAVLFYPTISFAREGRLLESGMWFVAALAFLGYGLLAALFLSIRLGSDVRRLLGPLVKLGAIAMTLAGPAWAVSAAMHGQASGDYEFYGFVFGGVMAAQGVLTYWAMEQRTLPAFS